MEMHEDPDHDHRRCIVEGMTSPSWMGSGPPPSVISRGEASVKDPSRDVQNTTAGGAWMNEIGVIRPLPRDTPRPDYQVDITPSPTIPTEVTTSPAGITSVRYGGGTATAANHDHRLNAPIDIHHGVGRTSQRQMRPDESDHATNPLMTSGNQQSDIIMQVDQVGLRNQDGKDVYDIQEYSRIQLTLPFIRIHESWGQTPF